MDGKTDDRPIVVFDPYPISGLGVLTNVALALPEATTTVLTESEDAALDRIAATDPALVIARAEPATALRFATVLGERHRDLPLLLLLPGTAPAEILTALREAGVTGMLPTHATAAELRVAVAQTYFRAGGESAGPRSGGDAFLAAEARHRPLSGRERTVLGLAAEGMTNEDIARRLYLSPDTVRCHMRSVLSKLSAHNRTHAVALGYRRGLLTCADQHGVRTRSTVA